MPKSSPRPLFERCRILRVDKRLSQYDAARMFGRSQAFISLLEQGHRTKDEREYLKMLQKADDKRKRTPSGALTAGSKAARAARAARSRPGMPNWRESLLPKFDYAATLPQGAHWEIVRISRTASDTEFAFLYDEESRNYGLVGFHLIDGDLKRGRIIPITPEYAQTVGFDLAFFAKGFELEDDAPPESDDDGLLADDVPDSAHA